ncbi:hypothetical protein BST61_g2768 [Cercospora zeina]
MTPRAIYLARYRESTRQRAHFALFVPNEADDRAGLSQNYRDSPCRGTVIHVVGEPIIAGRNYDCSNSRRLGALVRLGYVDEAHIYASSGTTATKDSTPRAPLEREATLVPPPPRGQNVRAPIDGVNTRRCQEWTMEYLQRLVAKNHIETQALAIANNERDPPNLGIFGQ